ncbi:MAG: LolA family protein [Lishizhenia sp.]
MKIFTLTLTLLLASSVGFAQDKSKTILDQLSQEMKALKSFYVEFEMKTKNASTGQNDTDKGNGFVKDNKFFATLGSNTILSNGLKIWTISNDDQVTYESDADEDDEESINPKKLMTIWENGFKSKYVGEKDGKHQINLYPTNPGEVEFHTITLFLNSSDNGLYRAIMKTKDGTQMTYTINKFTKNTNVTDTKFVYNPAKYPGYELIKD